MNARKAITIALITGLAGATTAVIADDTQKNLDIRTRQVRIADLNPNLPADAEVLLARVRTAVGRACRRSFWPRDLREVRDCQVGGYQQAVAAIDDAYDIRVEEIAALAREQRNDVAVTR